MVAHGRGQQQAVRHLHRKARVLARGRHLHQRGGHDIHVDDLPAERPDLDQIAQLVGPRNHPHERAQETHHQFLADQDQGRRERRQRNGHALQLRHPDAEQQQEHHCRHHIARRHGPGAIGAPGVRLQPPREEAVDQLDHQRARQDHHHAGDHVDQETVVGVEVHGGRASGGARRRDL
ncbi:hypothetical protein D3C72_1402690 [compost metagenome]